MFKDLFNFKKVRTPNEAVGFYIFYAGLFLLVSVALS